MLSPAPLRPSPIHRTSQAQESNSTLYAGLVTGKIDPAWGIVAVSLDVSLRLTMAIEVIGGSGVREG